jgi:hypothetical protein
MHDRSRTVLVEDFGDKASVSHIAAYESVPRIVQSILKRVEISGVCKLVEVNNSRIWLLGKNLAHEAAADESCAAGDQNRFGHNIKVLRLQKSRRFALRRLG